MALLRDLYHRAVVAPGAASLFSFARRDSATVFMCHRFRDRDRGIEGLDPAALRAALEYLRRHKYVLLPLADLFERLAGGAEPLRGAVVFTIDDGYIDHAEVAAPVFAAFDCPVTTFVTTGFLDGAVWMWWDKVEHVFVETTRNPLVLRIGGHERVYDCSTPADRAAACARCVGEMKPLPHDDKLTVIASLASAAEIDLPHKPPERYRPMSWDNARRCERSGMTFGPHTVTHPILTTVSSEQSEWEIVESWRRLKTEAGRPVPVYCYPNGELTDFGDREIAVLRRQQFAGAVVGEWGFADRASFTATEDAAFWIRRLPFPERLSDVVQYVCGIERCKTFLRGLR
jgi:peptidoglycan/xylan/chitin deacetylase (PgdA/CDA1 family)